jgi:hypothetical protein
MKSLLIILTGLVGLSAITGGTMLLLTPDGSSIDLSSSFLQGTPFGNYAIPGMVLLMVIGGSHTMAMYALWRNKPGAFTLSFIAGILLLGWMAIQILLIGPLYWLQFFLLGAGLLIILISLQLKGKALT